MIQDIWKWLEGVMEQFKDFIFRNHDNPILWLALFCAGLAVFAYAYNTLNKNK